MQERANRSKPKQIQATLDTPDRTQFGLIPTAISRPNVPIPLSLKVFTISCPSTHPLAYSAVPTRSSSCLPCKSAALPGLREELPKLQEGLPIFQASSPDPRATWLILQAGLPKLHAT